MKDKYLLKDWSCSHYFGYLIMHGNVYGNFKFKDGTSIHTSNVVNIVGFSDHKEIETRNSIYCIYPEDVNKGFSSLYPDVYEKLGDYKCTE